MDEIRAIAFYLPQYHPIKENDAWWGSGFTEWRNVAKARPLFPGHYQPHIPADLGFYDLRLPEVREAQANLARQYGIHGFCYYHYWFNGRRILERPFNEMLSSGKPDFPFCLCWANENWTRAWDGGVKEVLLEQNYGDEDDRTHIQSLIPALLDSRYIRIDGRPLLLIYRTELLPNAKRTADIWREESLKAGVGEIYLARVESFTSGVDPRDIGFDAAVEFAPNWRQQGRFHFRTKRFVKAVQSGRLPNIYLNQSLRSYDELIMHALKSPKTDYVKFRGVTPGFDNSARRSVNGAVFIGATPEKYSAWLGTSVCRTRAERTSAEQIVFINAWNEWAEGNHLEPDLKYGHSYLDATRRGLNLICLYEYKSDNIASLVVYKSGIYATIKKMYWNFCKSLDDARILKRHIHFWSYRQRYPE